jgi:hypothetical protein
MLEAPGSQSGLQPQRAKRNAIRLRLWRHHGHRTRFVLCDRRIYIHKGRGVHNIEQRCVGTESLLVHTGHGRLATFCP